MDASDLAQHLELVYEAFADRVALRNSTGSLTYSALHEMVKGEHQRLNTAGVAAGDVLAIDFDRSVSEAVAILALVRAGAAWSAVDSNAPDLRLVETLHRLRPDYVWAQDAERTSRLHELAGRNVRTLAPPRLSAADVDVSPPPPAVTDENATAYIAFTSGSTGTPKGVVVPRRAVMRLVLGAPRYAFTGPDERYLRLAPLAFDASTFEIFCSLGHGSSLCIFDAPEIAPPSIAEFIANQSVTVTWFTAGLFRLLVDERIETFAPLRQVLTGGDSVSAAHAYRLLATQPQLRVTNGYGPTENTTFTSTWTVDPLSPVEGDVPIGLPVFGTEVAVLREDGADAPHGEIGELYVTGTGLAKGYVNDPANTMAAFTALRGRTGTWYRTGDLVTQDRDGVLRFRGRRDRQVKIRGYRVEMAEIENCLRADAGVRDAEVLAVPGATGGSTTLAAALVLRPGHSIAGVRERLTKVVPLYSVPTRWVALSAMLLSSNGKVDHAAVVDLVHKQTASRAKRRFTSGETEVSDLLDLVREAWIAALQDDDFDDNSSFFEIGGDSLSVTVVRSRILEAAPWSQLRVVDLFINPTIVGTANFLAEELVTRGDV